MIKGRQEAFRFDCLYIAIYSETPCKIAINCQFKQGKAKIFLNSVHVYRNCAYFWEYEKGID